MAGIGNDILAIGACYGHYFYFFVVPNLTLPGFTGDYKIMARNSFHSFIASIITKYVEYFIFLILLRLFFLVEMIVII